jgi:hypothetical protein
MKIGLLIFGLLITLTCCKPTEFVGHYELRNSTKTSLDIKNDGKFEFYSFDNPADGFFVTTGTWTAIKNQLSLTSLKEASIIREPEIKESLKLVNKIDSSKNIFGRLQPMSFTTFTSYDIFGDTVDILSGNFPDGSSIYKLHKSMRFLEWPTIEREGDYEFKLSDTIEFHFWGYKPYLFVRPDRERRNYKVLLFPETNREQFNDKQFVINRRRIKDHKVRFDKKKTPAQHCICVKRG